MDKLVMQTLLDKIKLYRNKEFNRLHTQQVYDMKIHNEDIGKSIIEIFDIAFERAKKEFYKPHGS